jgi:Zn-dependent M28 family amino/carboxypeptidase
MKPLLAMLATAAGFVHLYAQAPHTRLNPVVQEIVAEISEDRIAAHLKKLESFGTRHIASDKDHSTRGIGAAQRWLHQEFSSYSPRLEVHYDTFVAKKAARVPEDVELANVVALLPGKVHRDRYIIVSAHYDTIVMSGSTPAEQEFAPGVNDDGSGVAAVLELARVMSKREFDKSILFIAFSAEEVGLLGSRDFAKRARAKKDQIEAVINNDIIGNDRAGNGHSATGVVRLFSDGPEDSGSRSLARYVKEVAERYVPSMKVDLIFRADRFSRDGDHTPFHREGFAGVRLTTASENYSHQHTITDTFENVSVPYNTRVARVNAAVLASLALSPVPPSVMTERSEGEKKTYSARIGRGQSRYDAALQWSQPEGDADIAGYIVMIRSTTSALWEKEIWVGDTKSYTLPDVSIDDKVFGIRAVDKDGNCSLVSAYTSSTTVRD